MYTIKRYALVALLPMVFQFTNCEESCQMGAIDVVKTAPTSQVIDVTTSEALNKHKKSGKPMVVKFYTDWCNPCKDMKEPFANLAKEYTNVTFIAVNGDHAPSLTQEFNVEGYPTLAFFDNNGDKLFVRVGGATKGALSDLVEKLSKGTMQKQEVKPKMVDEEKPKAEAAPAPTKKSVPAPVKKAASRKKTSGRRQPAPKKTMQQQPKEVRIEGVRYVAVVDEE